MLMDEQAITVWRWEDAPSDLQALAGRPTGNDWIALVPQVYADRHDLYWLECIDAHRDPEMHMHPSMTGYQVWIGNHG